ncbi:MAG: hypothetical protein ACREVK_13520 [Gammaproteobacteria bacterium]
MAASAAAEPRVVLDWPDSGVWPGSFTGKRLKQSLTIRKKIIKTLALKVSVIS